MSFDGGLRLQRARGAHHRPRRGTPSKTEHVEKIEKNRMRPLSGPLKLGVSPTMADASLTVSSIRMTVLVAAICRQI